jgi:Cu(I)/Ag(I) efflux system periplasmic protein CusF
MRISRVINGLDRRYFSLLAILIPAFGMNVCHPQKPDQPAQQVQHKAVGPAAAVATTTYQAVGRVVSLNLHRPSIEIDHEDIIGLMPAMKMEFFVKQKSLLDGLKAGDQIDFSLDNGVGGLVITRISKK